MTLEDVYQILWILIIVELVVYDVEEVGKTYALQEVFDDPHIAGYLVAWQDMVDIYAPLSSVLVGLIGSFLIPDRRAHEPREPIPALEEVNDDDDDQGRGGGHRGGGRGRGKGRRGGRGGVIGHDRGVGGGGGGGGDEGGDGNGGG
ncbi:uncharacterized protein LOC131072410 [Cryptomeria japonica]|uniref:uncharacterized protein LOC131072410 n=1 Tax=Cryptomeria japonica TaxID=3369 RepID=UPI0025ABC8CA|nr:uncharacterized protein LOC131072410 [Cryptomeria japonica]